MNELPSTEFRKQFARLAESTLVTVNGHPLGVWTPASSVVSDPDMLRQPLSGPSAQARRDDLLRKINKR